MSAVAGDRSLEWAAISGLLAALTSRRLHDPERDDEVARLAVATGTRLGCSEEELLDLAELAALHDIGLVGISDAVVHKDGALSAQERAELCTHPQIGAAILHSLGDLSRLAPFVACEHEQWDGLGYPAGVGGEDIPLMSRILLACDAYVAMLHPRADRPALGHATAVAVLERNAGTQFCPSSVAALVAELRGDEIAVIEAEPVAEPEHPAPRLPRPEVRLPRLSFARFTLAGLVGLVVGAVLALPPADVGTRCPPPGEGRLYCELQKAWLPAAVEILAAMLVCIAVAHVVLVTLPRWRRGELRRHKSPWPDQHDPLLAAASWMLTIDDAKPTGGTR